MRGVSSVLDLIMVWVVILYGDDWEICGGRKMKVQLPEEENMVGMKGMRRFDFFWCPWFHVYICAAMLLLVICCLFYVVIANGSDWRYEKDDDDELLLLILWWRFVLMICCLNMKYCIFTKLILLMY